MVKDVYYGKTLRKSFARHEEILDMPNLLEVQKNSYQWFLDTGLREVFKDVASITDYAGNLELSFIDYSMDEPPKYSVEECKARDATYAAPIKVRVRLRNKETEEIKEQEIFMGDFPIMTNSGTFVINGAERVIVSQIVRSPGMYYTRTADKADNLTFATTVIPYRGAWLEYETDLSDVFYVRIDKNRKLPITCLIRAIGPKTDAEIIEMFVVELLTGIWHGANWNFICWGLYYFVLLAVEKLFLLPHLQKGRVWPHIYTLFLVVVGWAMFVGNDTGVSFGLLFHKLFVPSGGVSPLYFLRNYGVLLVVSILCCTPLIEKIWNLLKKNAVTRCAAILALLVVSTAYVVGSTNSPFLYFNF